MRLLLALMLFVSILLPEALGDEWVSDKHRVALTIPTQESWTAGKKQALPNGEVLLHAVSMEGNEGIIVAVFPDMPTTDVRDPEIERRVQQYLVLQGWNLEIGQEVQWQGRKFLQFIGRRKDAVYGQQVGLARGAIRAGDLFMVIAYGRGDLNKANNERFQRVLNTFRFTTKSAPAAEKGDDGMLRTYRIAMAVSAVAACLLLIAFGVTIYFSRPNPRVV